MDKADFGPFVRMLTLTAEQYGKTLSSDLIEFYFDGCSHLSLDAVRASLNKHMRNTEVGQFMPKIADIIRGADGGADAIGFEALRKVQNAFSSIGAWESPTFDDPLISHVISDMGGWPEVCGKNAEEWANFGTKEFIRRYRALRERGDAEPPKALPGYIERGNAALGFSQSVPSISAVLDKIPDLTKGNQS